jgi:hypothetical protein
LPVPGCARHAATLIRLPLGCAVCVGAAGGRALATHAHRSLTATVALDAPRRLDLDGRKAVLPPGAVLLIPAGFPHAEAHGGRAVSLSLPPALLPQAATGVRLLGAPELAVSIAALAGLGGPPPPLRAVLRRLAEAPFLTLAPSPPPPPADVNEARARLAAGKPANGRGGGFAHRFRRHVGLSPTAWRGLMRVRRACALLVAGEAPAAAAAGAGFFDQSHMTRHFLRFLGMTPGEYRAAFAAMSPPV